MLPWKEGTLGLFSPKAKPLFDSIQTTKHLLWKLARSLATFVQATKQLVNRLQLVPPAYKSFSFRIPFLVKDFHPQTFFLIFMCFISKTEWIYFADEYIQFTSHLRSPAFIFLFIESLISNIKLWKHSWVTNFCFEMKMLHVSSWDEHNSLWFAGILRLKCSTSWQGKWN